MEEKLNIAKVWMSLTRSSVVDEMKSYLASRMAGTNTAMELGLAYGIYKLAGSFASLEPEDWDAVSENLSLSEEAAMDQLIRLVAGEQGNH